MDIEKTVIKAVTFDLWETLIFERNGYSKRRSESRCKHLTETLNKLGVNLQPEQVKSALDQVVNHLLKLWDRNKDITHLDQINLLIKYATNGAVKPQQKWMKELSAAYITPLFEVPPYLNPDAHAVLQQLKDQKKRIGLICNTGLTPGIGLRKFLQHLGVAQFFDTMIFTDEVKIRKPDPKIFRLAARKLKAKPNQAVHVGDNLKTDVWGAKSAGFKAIHLSSQGGIDKTALSDPNSLMLRSRNIGQLKKEPMPPDKTITSLGMVVKAIEQLTQ